MTNIQTWLAGASAGLEKAGIGTARLDALVLLEDVMGRDRAWLLAHGETEISAAKLAKLTKLLNRRAAHEPLAYVRGQTEFYGRDFVITPAVLEPRPESEAMIGLFKALAGSDGLNGQKAHKPRIADVGTGSGALGITAALEVPKIEVELLDIDLKALEVAKMNVDKFTLSINVIKADLLLGSNGNYDLLLCNLPYVPDDYHINLAASHEPRIAIFGGPDGLDLYRQLFGQLSDTAKQPLYILTESLPPQHPVLQEIAAKYGYELLDSDDFVQLFKLGQKHSK